MTIGDFLEKVSSEVKLIGYSTEEDSYTTIPAEENEGYYDYSVIDIYVPNNDNVIVVEFYLD